MISVERAFELVDQVVRPLAKQQVSLPELVGRVLVEPIVADVDSPPHDKSVMDGFAVRAADIQPGVVLEVTETIVAGAVPTQSLGQNQAARIMTGAPIPDGSDAVIMVELADCEPGVSASQNATVRFHVDDLRPERHVLRRAANFYRGQEIFPAGHLVRPSDIGLLAEVGAFDATVRRQPTVGVLPTGDELVDCQHLPAPGQIRNSNGPMLLAMLRTLNTACVDLGIGRDDEAELKRKIETGLENDMLILSGGVSAGTRDLVPGILKSLGVEEVFHKVKVKPGKPVWFGVREQGGRQTVVFGLPGNPVSSLVGFHLFARAALRRMAGSTLKCNTSRWATLATAHQTRGDRPTYWPGQTVRDASTTRSVKPLKWNGSSDLLALGSADGLIYFLADQNEYLPGQSVTFYPF